MKKEQGMIGKKVRIQTADQQFGGILIDSYDPEVILLKLSSGYNIGIEKARVKGMEEVKEAKEKPIVQEIKVKSKANLPGIAIIATGGTISSKLDYATGAVKPLTRPEEILAIAPKIQEIANITSIETPFLVLSENMTSEHWKKLAQLCEKLLNKPENKGIIILHGTDILHYTSAALSFMLPNLNKPVVLTYAQRSTDRGSTDALLNLTCSCHAALSDIAEVMIVGHATSEDNFCFALRGTKTRKMHTSRRDTFRPVNTKPIASIWEEGKIEAHQEYNKRDDKKKVKAEPVFEEKVALIKWHPNASPDLLDFFIKQKYKGIVIEATGFGHVAIEGKSSWFEALKKAVKNDIVVCFALQTLYGRLNPLVYSTGRILKDAGIIYLEDMLPETAYIKLACLLGKEKDADKVKELMLQNLAREFNPRLGEKDFLI
jgi:glutamyl-tRNA(Gln) amidotransferase subunit D